MRDFNFLQCNKVCRIAFEQKLNFPTLAVLANAVAECKTDASPMLN